MNGEIRPRVSMRLYRAAGICALAACALWPITFFVQLRFVFEHIWVDGVGARGSIRAILEQLRTADLSLVYDVTHLFGVLPLIVFLALFAVGCLTGKERAKTKERALLLAGMGLESYTLFSFACHILMAVILYYKEWSLGVSHDAILRILFTALGSGFAELLVISFFAVSLLLVGRSGKNRSVAVAAGAICIYRLFEDSLWLLTGLFDGTLHLAPALQTAHGVLYLVTMSLTLAGAVMVSMSSLKEIPSQKEEGRDGV
ncbi:MAG: hypothetical protein J6M12_06950 [Clostridia bacterium]|nr:hypothetical protein [Clostridia bacterium]